MKLQYFLVFAIMLLLFPCMILGCSSSDDDDDDDNDTANDDDDDDNDTGGDDDDDDDNDDNDDNDDDDDNNDDDDNDTVDLPPTIDSVSNPGNTLNPNGPYTIEAQVSDDLGIASVKLFYKVNGQAAVQVNMSAAKTSGTYQGNIPGQTAGSLLEFYVEATDTGSQSVLDPATAPSDLHSFYVLQTSEIEYDDGSAESNMSPVGLYSGAYIRFTPPAYPAYLIGFSHYAVSKIGTPLVQLVVLYDSDGLPDPPNINQRIDLGTPFTPTTMGSYVDIDLLGLPELATPLMSGDFYVGYRYTYWTKTGDSKNDKVFWGRDTGTTNVADRNWEYNQGTMSWVQVPESGTYMFKVIVATP